MCSLLHMTAEERKELATVVLDGLSVGDAFGELFAYGSESVRARVEGGVMAGPWWWTDDTAMALGIMECLLRAGTVEEPTLAWIFSRNFKREPDRGYGRMARKVLEDIAAGEDWKKVSSTAFQGGSMGNGAAMRVGPIGAWFAHDLERVSTEAWRSARVTHWHPEGVAGAVAVATAVAVAWQTRALPAAEARAIIEAEVQKRTPEGATRTMIVSACKFDPSSSPAQAGRALGNGSLVTAPDTVPYVIWSALRSLDNYAEALVATVEGGGDCDTNAAMVGSVLAARLGRPAIPKDWLEAREPLPSLA
jgi:ADP-ribosylglycohydrolase